METKYASEVYEFLRLFRRTGRSVLGFLLLQVSWVLFLWLLTKISTSQGGSSVISIPVPDRGKAPYWQILPLPVAHLWLPGALAIALLWSLLSQFYRYFVALFIIPLKYLVTILGVVFALAAGVVNLLLLPITWPLEHWLTLRSLARKKQLWMQNFAKLTEDKKGGRTPEAAYAEWLKDFEQEFGVEMRYDLELKETALRKAFLVEEVGDVVRRLATRLHSSARIGISPFASYSYIEDFQASKLPLQVFAVAISRVKTRLRELRASDYIQFVILPPQVITASPNQAAMVSRLFDLDVLLWGSYVGTEGDIIWLNVFERFASPVEREESRDFGSRYQNSFFPHDVQTDVPGFAFTQNDHVDAYLVLQLAVLQVLQNLQNRRKSRRFRGLWDELQTLSYGALDGVLLQLVTDASELLSGARAYDDVLPSAKLQLADLVSDWVGYQLQGPIVRLREEQSLWGRGKIAQVASHLAFVLEECADVRGNRAVDFYRLGALACLRQNKEEALKHFRRAMELDSPVSVHPIGAKVAAEMALNDALRNYSSEPFGFARFAAHAASALSTGDEFAIRSFPKMMRDNTMLQLQIEVGKKPLSIAVVEGLLAGVHAARDRANES